RKIDELLQSVAAAMAEGQQRGIVLARWAARALPRLPEAARETESALVVALGAGVILGGREILERTPTTTEGLKALSIVLPKNLPRVPIKIRLVPDGIEFSDQNMRGAHVAQLPKSNPMLLELTWHEDGTPKTEFVNWRPNETKKVAPVTADEIT